MIYGNIYAKLGTTERIVINFPPDDIQDVLHNQYGGEWVKVGKFNYGEAIKFNSEDVYKGFDNRLDDNYCVGAHVSVDDIGKRKDIVEIISEGTILIAKDPCKMENRQNEFALIVGKEYTVKGLYPERKQFTIDSELGDNHFFNVSDDDRGFRKFFIVKK